MSTSLDGMNEPFTSLSLPPHASRKGEHAKQTEQPDTSAKVATAVLQIEASAIPNPGEAAWGAVCTITVVHADDTSDDPRTHRTDRIETSAKCGVLTNNAAEYMGLIGGLRATIRHLHSIPIRPQVTSVRVICESELVTMQMTGRYRVRDARLAIFYAVAKGLQHCFQAVTFRSGSRSEKGGADLLMRDARSHAVSPWSKVVFYPAQVGLIEAFVFGHAVRASHDLGTRGADPRTLIDARFLRSLPDFGPSALKNLADAHPMTIVLSKVCMTVLGTIAIQVGVVWPKRNGTYPVISHWVNAVVVDSLPVPLHISTKDNDARFFATDGPVSSADLQKVPFGARSLPNGYGEHPYWTSDVVFIGHEWAT